nr:homeobox protein CDX-1-like [Peromyscus maniculatus bairdii]
MLCFKNSRGLHLRLFSGTEDGEPQATRGFDSVQNMERPLLHVGPDEDEENWSAPVPAPVPAPMLPPVPGPVPVPMLPPMLAPMLPPVPAPVLPPVPAPMLPPMPGPVPAPMLAPVPAPRCKRASSNRFAHWQRHELESVFQHTHYITADVRKQLAASMGVSEAKVQNWFKKKREQYRKYQKP